MHEPQLAGKPATARVQPSAEYECAAYTLVHVDYHAVFHVFKKPVMHFAERGEVYIVVERDGRAELTLEQVDYKILFAEDLFIELRR